MSKIKLALLSGGMSGEREVSLKTGEQIFNALDKEKYEIFRYDPKDKLREFINDALDKKFDIVLPALHGPFGEDGRLQGMLDLIGVPYVFSGCLASALAMNKPKTKALAAAAGIVVAKDMVISKNDNINSDEIIKNLNLPIVIKPIELGSSVGMSIAKTKKELETGIQEAFRYGENILLEQYIKGRELTAAVMGKGNNIRPLAVVEVRPKTSDWFDYRAKYEVGATEEICPAPIPDELREKIQESAKKIYKIIGCKDLARADFIWDEARNELYFLEINTIPGMTQTSLAPQAAKEAGMSFGEFLDELIGYNV